MPHDKDPRAHTALSQRGRSAGSGPGLSVNPPVVRISTVLFDSLAALREAEVRTAGPERSLTYGANGNPTAFALQDLITELESAHGTCLYPTGLAAVAQMFQSFLRPGDHVLMTESVYGPVRRLANTMLKAFDIQFDYYAANGSNIESLIKPNTRMIYAEVPGSLTFDMCDLPALSRLCKAKNLLLAVDNSWGSGVLFKPLELGADISLMALTKYVAGHSDVMMGSVSVTEAHWKTLKTMNIAVGNTVSPDDAYLCCVAPAVWRHVWLCMSVMPCRLRSGCWSNRRWRECCIRRSRAIRATPSGSGISMAAMVCSVSNSRRPIVRCSTVSSVP